MWRLRMPPDGVQPVSISAYCVPSNPPRLCVSPQLLLLDISEHSGNLQKSSQLFSLHSERQMGIIMKSGQISNSKTGNKLRKTRTAGLPSPRAPWRPLERRSLKARQLIWLFLSQLTGFTVSLSKPSCPKSLSEKRSEKGGKWRLLPSWHVKPQLKGFSPQSAWTSPSRDIKVQGARSNKLSPQ